MAKYLLKVWKIKNQYLIRLWCKQKQHGFCYLSRSGVNNQFYACYHMSSLLLYIENVWQVKSWLHKAVMLWFLGISVLFLSSPCFCDLLTAVVTSSSSGTICKHRDFSTWEGLWWWWCSGNIHRYRYKLLWIKKSLCAINLALPVDRDKYTKKVMIKWWNTFLPPLCYWTWHGLILT